MKLYDIIMLISVVMAVISVCYFIIQNWLFKKEYEKFIQYKEKSQEAVEIAEQDYKSFNEWFSANTDKVEKMKDIAVHGVDQYPSEFGIDEDLFVRELRHFLFYAYETGKRGDCKKKTWK